MSDWLESETGRKFWAFRIALLIRNPTYRGHRVNAKGVTVHKCEPLVDSALWTRANETLGTKTAKRRPVNGASAFLTSVAFCGQCHERGVVAKMYKNSPYPGYTYYRCVGAGTSRKGCGNLIRLEKADAVVMDWLFMSPAPHRVPKLVKGSSHEAEIADVQLELADLPKRGLSDEVEDAERKRLRQLRDELEALPSVPDRIEMVDTGETIGEHFAKLDDAGKRAMLLADGVKVLLWKPEGERFSAPVEMLLGELDASSEVAAAE